MTTATALMSEPTLITRPSKRLNRATGSSSSSMVLMSMQRRAALIEFQRDAPSANITLDVSSNANMPTLNQ